MVVPAEVGGALEGSWSKPEEAGVAESVAWAEAESGDLCKCNRRKCAVLRRKLAVWTSSNQRIKSAGLF